LFCRIVVRFWLCFWFVFGTVFGLPLQSRACWADFIDQFLKEQREHERRTRLEQDKVKREKAKKDLQEAVRKRRQEQAGTGSETDGLHATDSSRQGGGSGSDIGGVPRSATGESRGSDAYRPNLPLAAFRERLAKSGSVSKLAAQTSDVERTSESEMERMWRNRRPPMIGRHYQG